MTDIILYMRLGIEDNRKNISRIFKFTDWLNQENSAPSYNDLVYEFINKVMNSAPVKFDGSVTSMLSHNVKKDYLENGRHPKVGKRGKWFLDEIEIKNKSTMWIKLENLWIKGKVEIDEKNSRIIIEPENVGIPITEKLFLRR